MLGCTDIGIGKSEFVAKTQFLFGFYLVDAPASIKALTTSVLP